MTMVMRGCLAGYQRLHLLYLLAVIPAVACLQVGEIKGPRAVMNGSMPLLVLDCDYNITEPDWVGFVVKWYFNRKPFPVYQWIPHNNPQGLGILKGRLDLEHQVSADEYKKHRALAIINPTTELSGQYNCWVSSVTNEDFTSLDLVVYVPPSEMSITYVKPAEDTVNVTCKASCISPLPNITIYRSFPNSESRIELKNSKMEKEYLDEEKCFNVSVDMELFDNDLETETLFECVLTIPGTEYKISDKLVYFPGVPTSKPSVTGGQQSISGSFLFVILSSLLFICIPLY